MFVYKRFAYYVQMTSRDTILKFKIHDVIFLSLNVKEAKITEFF